MKVCDNVSRYVSILAVYDLKSGGIVDSRFMCFGFF